MAPLSRAVLVCTFATKEIYRDTFPPCRCEAACLLSNEAQVAFLRILFWLANLDKGVQYALSKPTHRFLNDMHSRIIQAFKGEGFVINLQHFKQEKL